MIIDDILIGTLIEINYLGVGEKKIYYKNELQKDLEEKMRSK